MSWRIADVFARVPLRRHPRRATGRQLDVAIHFAQVQAPPELAQGVHDTVRMVVIRRPVAGLVTVLENARTFVFQDHCVVLGITRRRTSPSRSPSPTNAEAFDVTTGAYPNSADQLWREIAAEVVPDNPPPIKK